MAATQIRGNQIKNLTATNLSVTGSAATSSGYLLISNGTGGFAVTEFTPGAPEDVTYNNSDTTITLTISSLNSVLAVENSSSVAVNLPSVDSTHIGRWIKIYKRGAGNLTINASDSDVINDSSAGGSISNTESAQTYAVIKLQLITATVWATSSMPLGTWTTA